MGSRMRKSMKVALPEGREAPRTALRAAPEGLRSGARMGTIGLYCR
jgi:hypothetical protein